jgi:hypothetical protein
LKNICQEDPNSHFLLKLPKTSSVKRKQTEHVYLRFRVIFGKSRDLRTRLLEMQDDRRSKLRDRSSYGPCAGIGCENDQTYIFRFVRYLSTFFYIYLPINIHFQLIIITNVSFVTNPAYFATGECLLFGKSFWDMLVNGRSFLDIFVPWLNILCNLPIFIVESQCMLIICRSFRDMFDIDRFFRDFIYIYLSLVDSYIYLVCLFSNHYTTVLVISGAQIYLKRVNKKKLSNKL